MTLSTARAAHGQRRPVPLQDKVVVGHTRQGDPITFYHPAVQSSCMFLGEFLCLVPYLLQQWHRARRRRQRRRRSSATGNGDGQSTTASLASPSAGAASASLHHFLVRPQSYPSFTVHQPLLEPSPRPQISSAPSAPQTTKVREGGKAIFVLALPTLCDATSTILMNVGLYYTWASVFQMLRGTVVFFAGANLWAAFVAVLCPPACCCVGLPNSVMSVLCRSPLEVH